MRGRILRADQPFGGQANNQRAPARGPEAVAPEGSSQPQSLQWVAWFAQDGISLGPVWRRGSQLLAWEGSLGAPQERESAQSSGPCSDDVQTLMNELPRQGWRFLEGNWGPFRLVWLDMSQGTWIMARAPQGLKPLFWFASRQGLFFAQDIASLLDLMPFLPEPDWKRVPEYMVFQSVAAGNTLYQGVRELLPGELVLGDLFSGETRSLSLWPGWLEHCQEMALMAKGGAKESLWAAIRTSLMRESGASRGLFLSGGVDSALLAWGLKELDSWTPCPCMTVTCPGYRHDEGPFASKVVQELELPWEPIELSPWSFSRAWQQAIEKTAMPLTSTNQVIWWILCEAAQGLRVKRIFSGEGADGWLSGGLYQHEREALYLLGNDFEKTAPIVVNCRTHTLNDPLLVQRVVEQPLDLSPRCGIWKQCLESPQPDDLMEKAVLYHVRTVGQRLLTRAELVAQTRSLSLELPFLNEMFLVWSRSLGWEARNPRGIGKEPLKELCSQRFGLELAYRKKIGFPFPLRTWIRDSRDYNLEKYRQMLLETKRPIYSQKHLEKEVKARLSKSLRPVDWLLWSLINLELWLGWLEQKKEHFRSLGFSP